MVQVIAVGGLFAPNPVNLAGIGMPDCYLAIQPVVFLTNVITPANTFEQPFAIPNNPTLFKLQAVFQAAPLSPGFNPANLLISNAICIRLGL